MLRDYIQLKKHLFLEIGFLCVAFIVLQFIL